MEIIMKMPKIMQRNILARMVRDPKGPFTAKVERDKTKFYRKLKHKNKAEDGLDSKDT